MGNKFTRRRHLVDERYTKPQGLYPPRDVDHKKLRKLIIDAKLAPCYPGAEDFTADLDGCPICFLYYPSLNRSKCCTKGICTECFLQMKSPNAARPAQCPFCKTPNYAVEYRGAKTQEEKGAEQAEEQKVIEAKIRMRQQELQAEGERVQTRQEDIHAIQIPQPSEEAERQDLTDLDEILVAERSSTLQPSWVNSTHDSYSTAASVQNQGAMWSQILHGRHNRNEEFDLDLEDIMVMEAIWLSIQEHDSQGMPLSMPADIGNVLAPRHSRQTLSQETGVEYDQESIPGNLREMVPRSSVTRGLASAIATLAEHNVFNAGSTVASQNQQDCQISLDPGETRPREGQANSHHNVAIVQELYSAGIPERSCGGSGRQDCQGQGVNASKNNNNTELQERRTVVHAPEGLSEVSLESRGALTTSLRDGSQGSMSDRMPEHSSEAVEVGTSFSSSVPSASDLPWEASDIPQNVEFPVKPPAFTVQPLVVPESFEEQLMLAMALSIAEAQAQS